MNTPSPGPGWWLASDEKWYPQRWENHFIYNTNEFLEALLAEVSGLTKTYGEQVHGTVGRRAQRAQVSHNFKGYDIDGELFFECSIAVV